MNAHHERNEHLGGPTIQFLGAAGTVTGSRFLLSHENVQVMVDCGMFQGLKELRLKNWNPLAVDPASIDAVVLTHAHLDHCGYLPKLVKDGFKGEIHATSNTCKLVDVILRDSARLQTEDAKFAARHGFSKHENPMALYDEADAQRAIQRLVEEPFGQRVQVARETFVTWHPSGHILGAAYLEVEFFGKRVLFTGDMGRDEHPLLVPPGDIPAGHFDAIVTESTYGDREHEPQTTDFETAINEAVARGGSVLIPAFAVDRTEVILVRLRELAEEGRIPNVPIYADSPMALRALQFYREAINTASPEIRPEIASEWKDRDPFDPGSLTELMTVDESKSINNPAGSCIIISASGMATGGRVVHHLAGMLPNPKNTILLVGYQALGTRGRRLANGETEIKMHGEYVPVRAHVEQIQSFSVHADVNELMAWLGSASEAPGRVFVVHGEEGVQESLRDRIKSQLGWKASAPTDGQIFDL